MDIRNDILNAIGDPLFLINQKYQFVFANNACGQFFGSEMPDITSKSITDFYEVPFFNTTIKPHFDNCLLGNKVEFDCRLPKQTGNTEKAVFFHCQPHFNDASAIDGIIVHAKTKTGNLLQEEVKLAEAENRFKTFVENANDIIYQVSPEGVYTYASPNWTDILGYDVSEVIGEKVGKFAHPEDLPLCFDFLEKVLTTGEKQKGLEYRVKHKNGDWRWHISNGSPLHDKHGKTVSYLGVARDFTEYKQAHTHLLDTKIELEQILAAMPDALVYADVNRRIVKVNESFTRIFGYRPEEVIGQNTEIIYASKNDFEEQGRLRYNALVRNSFSAYEINYRNKHGEIIHSETVGTPVRDSKDEVIGLLALIRDITDRKLHEKEALEVYQRYQTMVKNFPNGLILLMDKSLTYLYAEGKGLKELGLIPDEFIGKTAKDFFPKEVSDVILQHYKLLFKGETCYYEVEYSGRFFANWGVPIKDNLGNIEEGLIYALDITELKSKEERLQETEKIGHIGHVNWDVAKQQSYWSDEIFEIYEQDPGHGVPGYQDIMAMHVPEDAKRLEKAVIKSIEKGTPYEMDLVSKLPSGKTKYLHIIGSPLKNEAGQVMNIKGVVQDITDRKLIENKLVESQFLFDNVLNTVPDLVSIHDADLNIVYSNWNGFGKVPVKKRKLNTKCYLTYRNSDIICPDCQAKNVLDTKKPYYSEAELPNGKWYEIRVLPLLDRDGRCTKFVEWVRDISDMKNSEMSLKEKNEEYETLNEELRETNLELLKAKEKAEENEAKCESYIDNAPDGVFVTNEKGEYLEVNKAACQITGYAKNELLKMAIKDIVHDHDRMKAQQHFQKVAKQGFASGTISFETKNREKRYWIVDAVKLSEKRFLGFTKDITEQIRAEEDTRLLADMLDTAPNSITIHNENGEFLYANQKSFEMHGYSPEEFMSLSLSQIDIPESASLFDERVNIIKRDGHAAFEVEHFKKDGSKFPLQVYVKLVNWKDVPAMLSIATDISERKKWINELVLAKNKAEEANRLKTEFLNNMSHEIRTPMNGIIGFSEMLDSTGISEEKRKYYSKIVQNSSHQLLRIIDDILEISTLETKQEKVYEDVVNLNDLLMELFSIFDLKSRMQNIHFYLKKGLNDSQSLVISDKTKLNKILGNLLENALKFTNKGFIELGYYLKDDTLVIYVKDTGMGISPENKDIIFERFSQENKEISQKHGGLGLGLSISKENARLLGGDITLQSKKGKGSTFFVALPFKPAKNAVSTAMHRNKEHTILVVEDDEVNYLFIEAILNDETEADYTLIHAKDGQEAVDICLMRDNIDLVLMDIKLPAIGGHEATRTIKSHRPYLPIIAQTAYSTESDRELALKFGCDEFISKPIKKEKLLELIKTFLLDN